MMPSNLQPSNKYLDSSTNMSFSLERRQSSGEQQVKERAPSHHENQNLMYQGKLKVKTSAPSSDLPHELRREADGKILVRPKSSGNHQSQYLKVKATKDDELVKYMSNLPGYLKRIEGGKSFQDKILNVGVLDWARLEKWKYNQKRTQASGSNSLSATGISLSLKTTIKSTTSSSATQGGTHARQSEQHLPLYPDLDSSHRDGLSRNVKQSSQKVLNSQDFEPSPKSNLGGQRKIPWTSNNTDVFKRGKTKGSDEKIASETGNFSTNVSNNGVALGPKEKLSTCTGEVKKRVEKTRESNKNRKASLGMGASYPKLRSHAVSLSLKEKISTGNVETMKRTEKIQESNIDLDHQHLPGKLENIVLLSPRLLSQNSSPEKSRVELDVNCTKANQKGLSGGFSLGDVCSAERRSDIPHSCPLPSKVASKTESNSMALGPIDSQNVEFSSDASRALHYSNMTSGILSEGKDTEHNTMKHVKSNAIENLEVLGLEMAEMAGTRSSNPSPNRRFSFSLSRMGRSFSWKESSAAPQSSSSYVSVKSGPVKSEEISCLDNSSRQKTNGHNRARSSPLRRILDPLLRSKSSKPAYPAKTNVQPLKGSSSRLNYRPNDDSTSLLNENRGTSTTQALLQLSIKNGLPLFKFAVDNNSSVLAATAKNLTSGKDDSGQHYTFYSVNEIKRKGGGWISQGSKQKSCGFVYNVVGQMVSTTYFSYLTGQNLTNQYMVRESVLFGVELRQADQASPKFMPSKELAAVVVKTLIDAEPRDEDMTPKCFTECVPHGGCSYTLGENDRSSSTTVVLPGGVHGLPNKGAPSPLIKRWKSGGLCDCGGWDVGCKLRVLANHNQSHTIPMTSNACPNSDRLELFEVGAQQNRPIFSLVPLNREIYSVEFNSSLSLLQALFVCVTVISSQKSSELSDVSGLCEAKVVQKEAVEMKGKKNPTIDVVGKMPVKYAPNPPNSPVGRV